MVIRNLRYRYLRLSLVYLSRVSPTASLVLLDELNQDLGILVSYTIEGGVVAPTLETLKT